MSKETYDIRRAQDQLDKDHYGLDKVIGVRNMPSANHMFEAHDNNMQWVYSV